MSIEAAEVFKKLREPFAPADLEWRLQESGKRANGDIWAKCVCYVNNRAIMDRLDAVLGPENWQNEYRSGPAGGVLCGITIRVNGEWITKWDGADNTQIEGVKGGLSGAMKRAAVQLGPGRYLYDLPVQWADIRDDGRYFAKLKDGTKFKWAPPRIPDWACPNPKQGDDPHVEPEAETPPAPDMTPKNAASTYSKARSAVQNAMDLGKVERLRKNIKDRASEFSADEYRQLEQDLAEAEARIKNPPKGDEAKLVEGILASMAAAEAEENDFRLDEIHDLHCGKASELSMTATAAVDMAYRAAKKRRDDKRGAAPLKVASGTRVPSKRQQTLMKTNQNAGA